MMISKTKIITNTYKPLRIYQDGFQAVDYSKFLIHTRFYSTRIIKQHRRYFPHSIGKTATQRGQSLASALGGKARVWVPAIWLQGLSICPVHYAVSRDRVQTSKGLLLGKHSIQSLDHSVTFQFIHNVLIPLLWQAKGSSKGSYSGPKHINKGKIGLGL